MAAVAAFASIGHRLHEAHGQGPGMQKYQEVMEKVPPKEDRIREGLVRPCADHIATDCSDWSGRMTVGWHLGRCRPTSIRRRRFAGRWGEWSGGYCCTTAALRRSPSMTVGWQVNKKIASASGIGRWEPRHALYTKDTFMLSRPSANESIHVGSSTKCHVLARP